MHLNGRQDAACRRKSARENEAEESRSIDGKADLTRNADIVASGDELPAEGRLGMQHMDRDEHQQHDEDVRRDRADMGIAEHADRL